MNLAHTIATLATLTVAQLRARYAEVFGETTNAPKPWLVKRIAWRLQAIAEGDLSQRARQRAAELANDADLRMNAPVPRQRPKPVHEIFAVQAHKPAVDKRLPPPGTILARKYKGETVQVQVLQTGFAYQGQVFKSLSAVAKAVTGSHCNGYLFFQLDRKGDE